MLHLTTEEILDFTTFTELTKENIALSSRVNTHILSCEECRKKVEAFQLIYEELEHMRDSAILEKARSGNELSFEEIMELKNRFLAERSLAPEDVSEYEQR